MSLVSSVMLVALAFFQWHLIHILTPFLMPFLWLMAGGFFLVTIVFSIIAVFKRREWKAFILQSLTVIFLFFFPFTQVVLNMDYENNRADRETVVKKVREGAITPNVPYNDSVIHLPEEYEALSRGGGDILVEKKNEEMLVLFFTFRGILDSFSGFVYSTSGNEPLSGDFGGDFIELEKLDKHWYYVSSG
ncbi:hypothetical protein LCD52_14275 [Rossellomorea vietnamensis]|uniref:hypothetical protein n=1 Tax=Rossellomorea vietnamensis TaxID=218284 RepID=UPI001CCCF4EA|nr:hypothetical protein [Rossellomorea vietnamensis]MCA0149962.1 hypothetical protein [Rossellomorea vietnamensis]